MIAPGISAWNNNVSTTRSVHATAKVTQLGSNRAFFAAILLFGLLAMTARPATDPDLWWHLRTGQWILETRHIPHSDPFSFTRAASPWVSHEWLSEIIFFGLWKLGGPALLIIFSSLITTAGFLLLYARCDARPHWAAAATSLGALASIPFWGARPQMFTFTLASLLLWLIERSQARPQSLLWIPPLFLVWLNLHAGYALGPALLLLYAAGLLMEAVVGANSWTEVRPAASRLIFVTLACMALVPLNPSGVHLYRYPLDTLRSPGMRSFIAEWFSPDFHQGRYAAFLLVFLLLLTTLAVSRNRIKARILLPLIFTLFAALDAVRHIPIFILLAVPLLASSLPASSPSSPLSRPRPRSPQFRLFFNSAAIALLAMFALLRWTNLARAQTYWEASGFPQQAVSFLRASSQPERIFAYYDWGGYIIWRLYPQYRVFVDGRADLYGDGLLHQFRTALELHNGWQAVLDTWDVGTVLVPPNCALMQALAQDQHWSSPYRDSKAVIFTRVPASVGIPANSSAP